ncbi:MAG: hypothetical protein WCK55_01045 [Verrucomicrobiota bacterium]
MTRLGKIARLPRQIREELNRRLSDGEVGKRLVHWLNTLPEVQAVLAAEFGRRPINEQNLSDWKQGGFEDWLRHQEARAWVQSLAEEEDALRAESGSIPLAERLTAPVLVGLGRLLRDAPATSGGPEQGRVLLGVAQQLAQLRRGNAQAERMRLERERWETEQEEAREEKRKAAECAVKSKQLRERMFPHLDEFLLPRANALPPEIQACLTANDRLREKHGDAANQGQST